MTRAIGTALGRPDMSLAEEADLARAGHPLAKRVFEDARAPVGTLVGQVNNILDVELIILSGEADAIFELAAGSIDSAIAQACELPGASPDGGSPPGFLSLGTRGCRRRNSAAH